MISDRDLTRIYNEANGLDPARHNPITTKRIFAAMRASIEIGKNVQDSTPTIGLEQENYTG